MNPMSQPITSIPGAVPTSKRESPEAEPRVARGVASRNSGLETPPLRWRAKRKAEVVLRLLRGEPLDKISRETAVPIPRLEEWRTQALAGMEQALQARKNETGVSPVDNGFRHSYISYRLAQINDTARVALEAGNSPEVIFQHYRELVGPDEAAAWFGVLPGGGKAAPAAINPTADAAPAVELAPAPAEALAA